MISLVTLEVGGWGQALGKAALSITDRFVGQAYFPADQFPFCYCWVAT